MPEPLEVPATTPPVMSTRNIARSPVTTIATVLAAVAQYVAVNGATLPQDTQGWISFVVGLVIAAGGALVRDPKALVRLVPVMLLCLATAGCKGGTPPNGTPVPTSTSQQAIISTLVVGATTVACSLVPAADRPAVQAGLVLFGAMLASDPTAAVQTIEAPDNALNANLAIQWLWYAVHSVLDPLGQDGWSVYGAALLRQATIACIQALG